MSQKQFYVSSCSFVFDNRRGLVRRLDVWVNGPPSDRPSDVIVYVTKAGRVTVWRHDRRGYRRLK